MHVEIIGSTSSGKTTLAKKMVREGKKKGVTIFLSDDFMLEQVRLNWIKNEFIRRRIVEGIAFAVLITCLARYKAFISFVIHESQQVSGSWFYKINRLRNVLRKIGIFEFIARRSTPQQVVLADNEGMLQGVHNLFVHQNGFADLGKIAQYVALIPLPDIILYLQQQEEVLVSRTLARGHGRVIGAHDKVVHFIEQAVMVFNEMVKLPVIRERLMIVNGQMNIQDTGESSGNGNFLQVAELVRSGLVES